MQVATMKEIMLIVSFPGSSIPLFLVLILSAGTYLIFKDRVNDALFLLLTPISYLYSVLLKASFKTQRPENAPNLKLRFPADVYGFPSSHTVIYTVLFGYLLYLTYSNSQNASLFIWLIRLVCCIFILLVGPSRVYLGFHSVKDVIGGYFFGTLFLTAFIFLKTYKR